MIIHKIRVKNFKSIYNPTEFDFHNMQGMWKITGDVGAGKTTIGEAILFGLFGTVRGKSNDTLISWGEKRALVELWCTSNNNNIYIRREINAYGQSPISIQVNGEDLVFSNKRDGQQLLESEYYDVSRTTVELLCIISFNNFKSIATLNTQDSKKFIDESFGFHILTSYADICKDLKISCMNDMNKIVNEIHNLDQQRKKLEEVYNTAKIDGDIDECNNEINQLYKEINEINENAGAAFESAKKMISSWTDIIRSSKDALNDKSKSMNLMKKGKCPTCGAKIDTTNMDSLASEMSKLKDNISSAETKVKELQTVISDIEKKRIGKTDPIYDAIQKKKELIIRLSEQERRMHININEISNIRKRIEDLENEVEEYRVDIKQWERLHDLLVSEIRSNILESIIPSLNGNISRFMKNLKQPYTIMFDSQFKCHVYIGSEEISISSLSTGQLKIADMIIIMGILGTVINSGGINIMFLDELFSNLDSSLRGCMCEMLRTSIPSSHSLFIISHTDIDDEYFDGKINVSMNQNDRYKSSEFLTENFKSV